MGIFKAYDIRGIYPDELTKEIVYEVATHFAAEFSLTEVAVGRDMRLSGDDLFEALEQGLVDQGVRVIDLGLISTDMVYFAVGKYGYDAGVMITASHNPAEYNGLKLCLKEARPINYDSGIEKLEKLVAAKKKLPAVSTAGQVIQKELMNDWIDHVLSFVDVKTMKSFNVVVDAANGMAGKVVPYLEKRVPLKIKPLFFELDGSFPNHPANPIDKDNLKDLQKEIIASQADFGLAFDGDADRVFLVDELGTPISGTIMTAMVAQMMLDKYPGATVLYNAICGNIVRETIEAAGGNSFRTRVGHSFVKEKMREKNAVFAGEHSGHYYFRDNYFADSGLIAAMVVCQLLSHYDGPLSELAAKYSIYPSSGEINLLVEDLPQKVAEVEQQFSDGQQDKLDGLTVRYADWWFNLRASNTEPLLRLNVEAKNDQLLSERVEELLETIGGKRV